MGADTEIDELRVAVDIDEEIGGFDISVDDATHVRMVEGVGGSCDQFDALPEWNRLVLDIAIDRAGFFYELQGDVGDFGASGLDRGLADIEGLWDVGMIEQMQEIGFAPESPVARRRRMR